MNVTKGPLVRQLRRESLKFTYGPTNQLKAHDHTLPWSQKYDREQELRASMSTADDEHVEALFGVDSIPWVHPVKETDLSGGQDSHRRILWEQALYAQSPDLRNDYTHIWAEGAPTKVYASDVMARFSNTTTSLKAYSGMYPNAHENNPGQYWKERASKQLYTHLIQEQEQARETARYGGNFALPTDDYQTLNGVMPLLNAATFRKLKYSVHEPIVRALNAATNLADLEEAHRTMTSETDRKLVADHLALTVFWRSIKPRGGPIGPLFSGVVNNSFGGQAQLEQALVLAAAEVDQAGHDATVWLVCDQVTKNLRVLTCTGSETPFDHTRVRPVTSLVLRRDIWSRDFDSAQEFAERYVQAYDWDYAGAAYCRAINVPRTEPLVF